MLELSFSRIQLSMEIPLSANSAALDEGTALEYVMNPNGNGQNVVQAGTGTANAVHAGAALSVFTRPSTMVYVDVLPVGTNPYTVVLSQTPTAATVVTVTIGGVAYTYGAGTPGATGFQVNGNVLTFNSAASGLTATVTYRYNITVAQAEMFVGDGVAGGYSPSAVTGTIGVIQRGVIFTSDFDTSKYCGAGNVSNITVGAGGLYTVGGAGAPVVGTVIQIPTGDIPFLGLFIRA
jgi:hypothetical protein